MDYNELQHWGVKGQKWGVRRYQKKDGSLTSAGKKRYSEDSSRKSSKSDDHLRAKALKKKRLSQLSNAELKELNNRMQLEQNYKNLKKQRVNAGQKFVKDVAYETAKSTASDYAKKYAKAGISFMVDSMKKSDE